ncbi:MAG TPA: ASPIC/UnbV domain-containing protein, partial [Saprospiraceae bacterium]|nr:ASPIC/UnbV domain-containing protein [Saprospiraceae bacterium]
LDLFATNSFWGGPWRNFLYRNNGDGSFNRDTSEIVSRDEGWSYGCAFGDFDRDGDLDLAVANCQNASQPDYLYENHASESNNRWLVVECTGTLSNRSAIGARVRVKSVSGGQTLEQVREISAQSGYCGQNQLAPHFGLGPDAVIESVTVEWPSGLEEIFGNILPNQYVSIVEGGGTGVEPGPAAGIRIWPPAPNPFHDSVSCRFELAAEMPINIQIVDIQGKTIKNLLSGPVAAGEQRVVWDGTASDGSSAPAGQYVLVFRQGNKTLAQY